MKGAFLIPIVFSFIVALIPMVAWGQNNVTNLRIAIPAREFTEFVTIKRNVVTGENNYSGYAIEVFKEVVNTTLASPIPFEFVPFQKTDGSMNGTFDDMLQAVASKEYDGAVGEISILFYRTSWVDFTMPYMESGISMLVAIRQQPGKDGGYSLKGITLAFLIAAFILGSLAFIVAAVYGCIIFARYVRNDDRRRDRAMWSLIQTRLLITTFFLMLLIPIACYIVSQTSSNISRHGSGTIKSLDQLFRSELNVGYREGSFFLNLLKLKGFPESRLKSLKSEAEIVAMLSKGTSNGGVDAVVANAPQLKLLQAKYCNNFTVVPTDLHDTGFGFAFSKGQSTLVDDISKGILKLKDDGRLGKIQDATIGNLETCPEDPSNNFDVTSSYLSPNYKWIVIIGGVLVGLLMLVSFIFTF